MAGQKIKIDIGTSYNGQGVVKACGGMDDLARSANNAQIQMGKLGGKIGKLGGAANKISAIFGGLPGPIGKTINSVQGLCQAFSFLKSGMGGVLTVGATLIGWMLKQQKQHEENKKAAIEHRKALRDEEIQKRIEDAERETEAEKKRAEELHRATEQRKKDLKELADANWNLYKAEKERQKGKNELSKSKMSNETARAVAAESDPDKKRLIQAQGDLKATDFEGQASIKEAKQSLAEEQAKLKTLLNKQGSEASAAEQKKLFLQIQEQMKKVDTAKIGVQNAEVKAQGSKEAAQRIVEEIRNEIEGKKWAGINEGEKKATEEAGRKADEESEKYNRQMLMGRYDAAGEKEGKLRQQIADIDENIKQQKDILKQIEKNQDELDKGISINASANGSGINGNNRYGNYNYQRNADGTLHAPDAAHARRVGEGGKRDANAKNEGPNITAQRNQRLDDLQWRDQTKGNLSKREKNELNDLKAWRDQKNGKRAQEAQNNLNNLEQQRTTAVQNLNTTLTGIKNLMNQLGLK